MIILFRVARRRSGFPHTLALSLMSILFATVVSAQPGPVGGIQLHHFTGTFTPTLGMTYQHPEDGTIPLLGKFTTNTGQTFDVFQRPGFERPIMCGPTGCFGQIPPSQFEDLKKVLGGGGNESPTKPTGPDDPKKKNGHNDQKEEDYCCAECGAPKNKGQSCNVCGSIGDVQCAPKSKPTAPADPEKPDPNKPPGGGTGTGGGGGGGCGPGGCGPGGGGGNGGGGGLGGLLGGMNPAQMLQGLAGLAAAGAANQANQGNQQAATLNQLQQSPAYATAMAQLTAAVTTPEPSAEDLLAQFKAQETAAVATATAAALAGSPLPEASPVDQINAYLPAPTASAAPNSDGLSGSGVTIDTTDSQAASVPKKSEYEID